MKVLVVVAHPRANGFVHTLVASAVEAFEQVGAQVQQHDLYAEGFDPIAPAEESTAVGPDIEAAIAATTDPVVAAHRRALTEADHLVVAHPNWWGKPPAIMAGWLDRVLVPGVAYRVEPAGEPVPLVRLRSILVLNTGDTTVEREASVFGDPLDLIWRNCVGAFLGRLRVERLLATPVAPASLQQRDDWREQARALAAELSRT